MVNSKPCSSCNGSGIVGGWDEYYTGVCSSCNGTGVLCEHYNSWPCQGCIEDLELEWYYYNNEIDHQDKK